MKAWYKIPSQLRRCIAYALTGLGITVVLALFVVGLLVALDRVGESIVEQLDGQAAYAKQIIYRQ